MLNDLLVVLWVMTEKVVLIGCGYYLCRILKEV